MKSSSILSKLAPSVDEWELSVPFFRHHKKALNKKTFRDLRSNSLEETQQAFILNNELHNFDEALEWLPLAGWGWL